MINKVSSFGRAFGLAVGLCATTALVAQTVPDESSPDAGLDLPANLEIFGDANPNVRKPTAIVNNAVITGTDIDRRVAMVTALNGLDLKNDKQRQQLRLQVLRSLIDETLEIQEARANEIEVTPEEISQAYVRLSQRFNRSPEEMTAYLDKVGSSEQSLKRQIQGEVAWNRLLERRVEPFVNVGDEEVQAILDRLEASKGTEEYHLKEIFLRSTPQNSDQVFAQGKQLIEQMKQGAPFEYLARTYSDATTRAVGGDLDWVRLDTLPEALADAAQQLSIGQVAGPVEVGGGFSILYLADKRQVLTADPRDSVLHLRQLTLNFPSGTTEAQAQARAAEFAKATQKIQGCGDAENTAKEINVEVVDNDSVRVRDLPPQLQEIMLKMKVGEVTPPFGSADQGVRVLVLCGRDDARGASLPSPSQVQAGLEQDRVNLRAQRMLRDLRRDAIIEYR
ncbi:peptidylprolyl isomerase [Stakelama saccharophila]|uniref:Parvulin-like PPIase n=1 Tax=Stakelama saccharophila TaxID=3075605 RepID=A0ABZ0B5E0_9SPHN|nr:peptidylprolyl isomerase [Stakelama sp. W311]WNO52503.1 peptidylprolyl isomerase [Stakelama sp. W311]